MATLFTLGELGIYTNQTISQDRYDLAHELVLDAIEDVVGVGVLTTPLQRGVKGIALEVAKQWIINPDGLRSRSVDDFTETYATETLGGIELTDRQTDKLLRCVGKASSGAFTIGVGSGCRRRHPSEVTYVPIRRWPWG